MRKLFVLFLLFVISAPAYAHEHKGDTYSQAIKDVCIENGHRYPNTVAICAIFNEVQITDPYLYQHPCSDDGENRKCTRQEAKDQCTRRGYVDFAAYSTDSGLFSAVDGRPRGGFLTLSCKKLKGAP